MQTLLSPHRRSRSGFAVLITLAFLTVMLTVFASMLYWSTTNANITDVYKRQKSNCTTMTRTSTSGNRSSPPRFYAACLV